MPFIPHTQSDIDIMLNEIGVKHINDLFDEIPKNLRVETLPDIPPALNEMALARLMRERAKQDTAGACYIGAGAYEHHIPAAVWEITSRGEFMTAYTPYQAEASQGTLQVLYEYQTMIASLMALDASNASLYDGASALAEAILMAARLDKKNKTHRILLPKTIHPFYRQTARTIASQRNIELIDLPFDIETGRLNLSTIKSLINENFTALVIPQPNFFGTLEEVDALTDWAHAHNALVIGLVNPMAMAWIKPPGEWGEKGADIACGEGQPLGVPLASGGPYYGFLCCRESHLRQLPGRIVGRTLDKNGRPGFVLTLQAREQHIRRARATSNICTNQGLLVTASTIYMSLMGPMGLKNTAQASYQNAHTLCELLSDLPGVKKIFSAKFFHEFLLQFDKPVHHIQTELNHRGIQAGFPLKTFYPELGDTLLVCVTETKTVDDLKYYADALKSALTTKSEGRAHA
ncbi:MAG: aminomethyl-transferring glycine dehydrogenase subunit GcvPA [Gammaproteobacteria bacterium]|nr:aminomethyl-transferring glycine dehydrogenase subunit GcvPA [Gammaproteobacteria bacterium]